jgi:hypothetical protein
MGLKMVDGTLLCHVSDMTLGDEVCKFKVRNKKSVKFMLLFKAYNRFRNIQN